AAANCPDLVFLGLGTGLGAGLVLGGRLHRGPSGGAGEIGHLLTGVPDGPRCSCGRTGCLQSVASGSAVLARAGRARGRPVGPGAFRAGLAAGEPWARAAFEEAVAALAPAVVNLGELLECARVVIGGGFGSGVPGLVAAVARRAARYARPGREPPAVSRAVHGPEASLYGAMLLARGPGRGVSPTALTSGRTRWTNAS
ncbi:ROK family protein, partial [Streptomyces gamaensis]